MAGLHRTAIILVVLVFSNLASASNDLGACSSSEKGHPETCHSAAKLEHGLGLLQVNTNTAKMRTTVTNMEYEVDGGRDEGQHKGKDHEEGGTYMEDEVEGGDAVTDMENEEVVEREEGEQQGKDCEDMEDEVQVEEFKEHFDHLAMTCFEAPESSACEDGRRLLLDQVAEGETVDASRLAHSAGRRRRRPRPSYATKDEVNKLKEEVSGIKKEIEGLEKEVEGGSTPPSQPKPTPPAKKPAVTPPAPTTKPAAKKKCPFGDKVLSAGDLMRFPPQASPRLKEYGCKLSPDFKMLVIMPVGWRPESITTENWFFGRPKVGNRTKTDYRTKKPITYFGRLAEERTCDSTCNSMSPKARFYVNTSCECHKGPSLTEPCKGKALGANCIFSMKYPEGTKNIKLVPGRTIEWFSICSKQADATQPLWCPPFAKGPWLAAINPDLKKISVIVIHGAGRTRYSERHA
eukprot:gnl/MRDRNA2_/MRDRNA2_60550_c0_seq1.p1 gnl/MRDRNA2_/MRDRNA2_60550_c0~~gnl/MRDRNA2_/MRDRNA2_60550_c0_seq1.p1  ORF type:complete len:461 (-),score=76.03 gnl/MRDRNA2_/MRDRNA2_60550_c0_seq1:302-1684(-)